MAWTSGTTIKAGVTSGKPGIGTGGFGDQVVDDLDYLKSAVDAVGVQSVANIYDDFVNGAIDTHTWTDESSVGALTFDAYPDHSFTMSTSGASRAGIGGAFAPGAGVIGRMQFDLDRDHSIRMITRWGKATNNGDQTIVVGFQDAALTAANACGGDLTDTIGFCKGTNNNTVKAYVSKGGVSLTVADNLSNWTNWMELRIDITFAGATKQVEFFIDGSSVGSTTDTAKIPVIMMRPMIGQTGGAAARVSRCDYASYFWLVRPLST